LAKQLDPTGAFTGFHYADLPTSVSQAYPAAQAGIEKLQELAKSDLTGAGLSITLPDHILPPLDKLLPELAPALAVSWADASGWHSRSREPFPGSSPQSSLTTVGGAALGVSILLPSLNRARETANRVKCASNERQIGQAILLWANDHRGKYPPTMGDLLDEPITVDAFICPSGDTALPAGYKTMGQADLAKWVNEHADYVYVGAGQNTMIGADQVVLYEKPADHTTGMNILFGDGHVEFDVMAAAVKQIQDQHKTVPGVPLPGGVDTTQASPTP
jgi:prepilin-type processing-associated H-X9-DG protein